MSFSADSTGLKNLVDKIAGERFAIVIPEKGFNLYEGHHPIERLLWEKKIIAFFPEGGKDGEDYPIIDLQKMEVLYLHKQNVKIDSFVRDCVNEAFKIVSDGMKLDAFYDSLNKRLFEKMRISKRDFTYMHHSFHWAFFLEDNSFFKSPFEYVQGTRNSERGSIKLKKGYSEKESSTTEFILGNYRDYLSERAKSLVSINISPQ